MEKKKQIALLVPCFNEEEAIRRTIDLTEAVLLQAPKQIEYIYIFVDDGSMDNTQHELEAISTVLPRECRILVFSRNFGKEAAMLAGLEEAKDLDGIIFMDADGQDPPEAILRMSELFLTEEYDDIYAQRSGRNDSSFLKKKMIEWHYKLLNHFSSFPIAEDVGDYRLLNRKAMDEVLRLQERCRYTKGLFAYWRNIEVEFEKTNCFRGRQSCEFYKSTLSPYNMGFCFELIFLCCFICLCNAFYNFMGNGFVICGFYKYNFCFVRVGCIYEIVDGFDIGDEAPTTLYFTFS